MKYFDLTGEYIQLIQLLKVMGWCMSGGEASELVDNGLVKVNGEIELRRRNKIRVGMVVEFEDKKATVSQKPA